MSSRDHDTVDLLTIGEPMICLAGTGGRLTGSPTLAKSVAGTESNVAVGLARLGLRAVLVARVGADPFGTEIRRTLRGEGVDVSHITTSRRPTGLMVKERLGPDLTNVYYYRHGSAASGLDASDVPAGLVAAARRVHVTGVTLALGPGPARAVHDLVDEARRHRVPVSFDPNIRRKLWSIEDAVRACRALLPYVDDLLLSEEEAMALTGRGTRTEALAELSAAGVRRVVLRRGEDGAEAVEAGGNVIVVPPHPVPSVVDPVGAGDAFTAGYLFELLRDAGFADALRTGAWAAARVVAHAGDYEGFPYRDEYEAFVAARPAPDR